MVIFNQSIKSGIAKNEVCQIGVDFCSVKKTNWMRCKDYVEDLSIQAVRKMY